MASKKKVVPRRKPSEGAKGKKPFRLEVGKTYESERGKEVRIMSVDFYGAYSDNKLGLIGGLWKRSGCPWHSGMETETKFGRLVREVVKRRGK
jgi:hypothetical protein